MTMLARLARLAGPSLLALLALAATACVAQPDSEPSEEATTEAAEALVSTLPPNTGAVTVQSINDGHCYFSVGWAQLTGVMPGQTIAWAYRNPLDSTCAGSAGYQVLGNSYGGAPNVRLAKSLAGPFLAAAWDYKPSPSGSSAIRTSVVKLDYTTLAVLKTSTLASPPYCAVGLSSLSAGGAGLDVYGSSGASCPIYAGTVLPPTVGVGPSYDAYYGSWFFDSSTVPSQVRRY